MSDCGCDKARRDLEEYLRNEVCSTEHADIRQHLESCPACSDEALVARTLTDVVARACRESAPEELRDLVLTQLRAAQATHH
ncbi:MULTISPECIES: zf-HC2 domain-containing protein [Microbacterium]|jgi:anti-sigma factor (TIGR02949 family)|uniref:zf-HC2 domain-containing protein n=1 Tax=Microbacterium TaxID=33882 RepID=UPI0006F5DCE2|nr:MULTISPECIES: zf-HC2 domain-containing protein [unclassified Microbacterium]KQS00146.1 alpha-ketoglutarate decarboxylase [Microbacterium sp. Leaf347]MBN9198593.1 zf-HC2 domain-containing protein [Microbacterium ginsengisoli]MCK9914912.1 zf-HC2 domain-containing protein [Microbacteriaceae bacterium K1510]OJU77687.1 MAG: alpha-ketoglutarate decarboxylase [Microbacterium sp. 71-23]